MKRCSNCGAVKPLDEFTRNTRTKDGKYSYCRACQQDRYFQRKYGKSQQEIQDLYDIQGGMCAICNDHHDKMKVHFFDGIGVISLLCDRCMRTITGFDRSPLVVRAALDYVTFFRSHRLMESTLEWTETWEKLVKRTSTFILKNEVSYKWCTMVVDT